MNFTFHFQRIHIYMYNVCFPYATMSYHHLVCIILTRLLDRQNGVPCNWEYHFFFFLRNRENWVYCLFHQNIKITKQPYFHPNLFSSWPYLWIFSHQFTFHNIIEIDKCIWEILLNKIGKWATFCHWEWVWYSEFNF